MNEPRWPGRRDWIAVVAAGAILGFFLLGVGARFGMRLIAMSIGQAPLFTIEGSIAVSLLGTLTGAFIATIFLVLRILLPTRRWMRLLIFCMLCGAIVLRGLRPVTAVNAGIFLPLFAMHAVLLHVFWCRIYLPRSRSPV
jgi:hypothetical protein